jgi:hypothetical protein
VSTKYATLLANKNNAELVAREEFEELKDRRERLREELDETVDRFDNEDFAAVFRELHEPTPLADEPSDE